MPRVVTLNASATEIVCGLGCEGFLVGRSHECDWPPSVRSLPVCTRPRFPTDGSSAEIDAQVKSFLAAGEPLYEVDAELVRELRPDVVLTQSQCAVCAVSDADLDRALAPGQPRPTVLSLAPSGLDDLWPNIHQVADALSMPHQAAILMREIRHRLAYLSDEVPSERPAVVCLEWLDPLMAAGNWVPSLVEVAGGIEMRGVAGKHSPTMTRHDLQTDEPDILIAMPCGFDLARTRSEMARFAADPRFGQLRAVRGWRVYVVDGNQYFNRPGPRLVDSAEILAEILHGDRFDFGYRGKAWERFPQ